MRQDETCYIRMDQSSLTKLRRFMSRRHSLDTLKIYLLYALSPIQLYYLRPNGKISYLYSDHHRFYGKYLVRCYFPKENKCLIMSTNASSSFPVVSSIIEGTYQEKCIRISIYHPKIKICLEGPIIIILDTNTASIVLEDGESLHSKCMRATGWSG